MNKHRNKKNEILEKITKDKHDTENKRRLDLYKKKYGNYWTHPDFSEVVIYIPVKTKKFRSRDKVNVMFPYIDKNGKVSFPQTILDCFMPLYTVEEYIQKYCIISDGKYYYKFSAQNKEFLKSGIYK